MERKIAVVGLVMLHLLSTTVPGGKAAQVSSYSPMFQGTNVTVTAEAGKTAILPCIVNFVGDHKVIWIDPRAFVLSFEDRRIIDDPRISIERPVVQEWNLHIRNVRPHDAGQYQCQINTSPIQIKKINLTVSEPPIIIEDAGDKQVIEGSTVILWCRAHGNPQPAITWYRTYINEPHMPKEVIKEGEQLKITNISRYSEYEYMCVATNGIGTPASREMKVTVQFPPEVDVPSKQLLQSRGKDALLYCEIEANPFGTIAWMKNDKELTNNGKYIIAIFEDELYKKALSLMIINIEEDDYGEYRCFATNELGSDYGDMFLGEFIEQKVEMSTSTSRPLVRMDRTTKFIYREPLRNKSVNPFTYRPGIADVPTGGVANLFANVTVVFMILSTAFLLGLF